MKLSIRVMPQAKKEEVAHQGDTYIVKVKAPAKEGKANDAVIRLLAAFFEVPKSSIIIKAGLTGRNTIIEILGR